MCVSRLQGTKGSVSDKLRLALVQLLSAEAPPSDTELQELAAALNAAGETFKTLSYLPLIHPLLFGDLYLLSSHEACVEVDVARKARRCVAVSCLLTH
jgi:hypothetical protein